MSSSPAAAGGNPAAMNSRQLMRRKMRQRSSSPAAAGGNPAAMNSRQLMRRKKRKFDYLTSSILKEEQLHKLASMHFKATYNWLLFLPSIAITLVSGILAVLVKSGLDLPEHTQVVVATSIACLSAVSVFWQSLMKQLDLGGRARLHDSAAVALKKLFDETIMLNRENELDDLGKVMGGPGPSVPPPSLPAGSQDDGDDKLTGGTEKESETEVSGAGSGDEAPSPPPNEEEPEDSQPGAVDKKDHNTLSEQYAQAIEGCDSVIPIKLSAAFCALESRVAVVNKSLMRSQGTQNKVMIRWEKVYPALYHQLTLTIINAKGWPFWIPQAAWAVDKTLGEFKEILSSSNNHEESDLLTVLVKRAETIERSYGSTHELC